MIRAAWHLAISSLAGRPGRSALLILAVALATSLTVATSASIDTLAASIRRVVGQSIGLTDLRITHRFSQHLDDDLLNRVRAWPQVKLATGTFETGVGITSSKSDRYMTAVARGIDSRIESQLNPLAMRAGRLPTAANEVTVNPRIAHRLNVEVDDELTIIRLGSPVTLTVVGIYEQASLDVLQQQIILVTLDQARALGWVQNRLNQIELQLHDPEQAAVFQEVFADELPEGAIFETPASASAGINRGLMGARLILMILTTVVFLAAGFIILTSLTTSVVEQLRELAVLRCVGAGRAQIAMAQLICGILLAGGGAVLGVAPGLYFAWKLYERHAKFLAAGFSPGTRGVAQALVAAMLAGLLGAAYPAVLAATAPPLEGLTRRARQPSFRAVLLCAILGIMMAAAPLAVHLLPLSVERVFWLHVYAGLPMLFIGFFLLTVPLTALLGRFIAPALARLTAVPPTLLTQQITSTPFRNGFTGGALMVALAMLVAIWTAGGGVLRGWFDNIDMPDGFVHSFFSLTDAQWEALCNVPAITDACPTTAFPVTPVSASFGVQGLHPRGTLFVSCDTDAFFRMADLRWVQGDPVSAARRLRDGGSVVVSREYLTAHGLGLNHRIGLQTLRGPVDFEIVGVVASPGLDIAVQFFGIQRAYSEAAISSVFGTREDGVLHFGVRSINLVLLNFSPEVSDEQAIGQIKEAAPGVVAGSSRMIRRNIHRSAEDVMAVISTIAGGALLIACLGVGNLILASLAARRFEMGVLRSIGAGPGMLGRLVAAQTLLVAIVGCIAGVALGYEMAWLTRVFHQRLLGITYTPQLPWRVVGYGALTVAAAALAAALPAIVRVAWAQPRQLLQSTG